MMNKTKWTTMLGVGGMLLAGGLAQAQDQPGAAGGAAAPGTITNETTTQQTTSTIAPADDDLTVVGDTTEDGTLVNTGGAPLLMAMSGAVMAGSALLIRRKVA